MDKHEGQLSEEGCFVALTSSLLNVQEVMDRVRSPEAGAIVLFAGEAFHNLPTPLTCAFPFL